MTVAPPVDRADNRKTALSPEGDKDACLEVDLELPLDAFDLGLSFSTTERVTGVFGPSGAGKTSLLESLAGWRRPRGRIVFGGEVWLDSEKHIFVAPEARRVGYVAQDGLLFPHLDVRGNLLSSRAARDEPEAARDHFDRVCGLLELQSLLDRSPRTLSGGERSRLQGDPRAPC